MRSAAALTCASASERSEHASERSEQNKNGGERGGGLRSAAALTRSSASERSERSCEHASERSEHSHLRRASERSEPEERI